MQLIFLKPEEILNNKKCARKLDCEDGHKLTTIRSHLIRDGCIMMLCNQILPVVNYNHGS